MNEEDEPVLVTLLQERFNEFVSKIPSVILISLQGPLTWMEKHDGRELFFSVKVLEPSDQEVHLAVSITTPGQTVDPQTGTLNLEITQSFILGV